MDRHDLSGCGQDRLVLAGVLVHKLSQARAGDPLRDFMGTLDAVGHFFNPWGHRKDQFQSWLTHFALVLEFEGDPDLWIMQRDSGGDRGGVELYRCPALKRDQGFEWEWGKRVRYAGNRPECILCNIAHFKNDFFNVHAGGRPVQRLDIWNRYEEQIQMKYSVLTKNCQHFCYDFYKYTLRHCSIAPMSFENFGKMIQKQWSKRGGWDLSA